MKQKSLAAKVLKEWKVLFECDVFETGSDQRGNKSSVFLVLIPPRFPWVWNLSQYLADAEEIKIIKLNPKILDINANLLIGYLVEWC